MADRKPPRTPLLLSPEALFRYQIVSAAKARALSGQGMDAAVRAVAAQTHLTPAGESTTVSARSIYRWLAEPDRNEPADPEPTEPARVISRALPAALLDFLAAEKAEDRYASIPELLRRALQLGVIGPHQRIDRTSVWRACVRLGLPLRRVPAKQEADKRWFAYPHRMMMVLADGKHFRAGVRRRKRVAVFFLDDATRFGLGVVVDTDETAELFLRGLHVVLRRFGSMDVLFLDRGPGFRADDTAAACHRLDVHLVLGTAAYPEGHGKIEKFNQTAQAQVLRGLVGAVDVDDDCGALELRLSHFLDHQIAGRAGRVDQGDLGVIALAAHNDDRELALSNFVSASVGHLNSTLIDMVQKAFSTGNLLHLETLSHEPAWSSFVQYIAHTYRQIDNHDEFAMQIEQVLRGTLGFQTLRRTHRGWADELVRGVYAYAQRIQGKPLALVDATGFSWESVSNTLRRISDASIPKDVWSPELFGERRDDLQKMMGILLQVPELREPLQEVIGGANPDGEMLALLICDWVQGRTLTEMAATYFGSRTDDAEDEEEADPVATMTKCCRSVFGRLTQTASWGLSALQSLTIGGVQDGMSPEEQLTFRNLPARVYYGVNTDAAVALRLLGVPRMAAPPLARHLNVQSDEPLHVVRSRLRNADEAMWTAAMGPRGASYRRVWSIIEGD